MNKEQIKKINIENSWEVQLPLYLDLYSKLNAEGQKEMKRQLTLLGKMVDVIQKQKKEG
tara:strand:+ start:103 stop:279 length:177 start_codon:yes stop_codon:yes gene_type:complete